MSIIILLVLSSVIVAIAFLVAFLWATSSGQYDDVHTPAMRVLFDDPVLRMGDHDAHPEIHPLSMTNYQPEPDHGN